MCKSYAVIMAMTFLIMGGCSSVPEQDPSTPSIIQAKSFSPAPEGKGFVYLFRDTYGDDYLKTYVNDKPLVGFDKYNNTLNKSFFFLKLDSGRTYKLGTISHLGKNEMGLTVESGKTYYVCLNPNRGILPSQRDLVILTEQKEIEDAQKSILESIMNNP